MQQLLPPVVPTASNPTIVLYYVYLGAALVQAVRVVGVHHPIAVHCHCP